MALVLCSADPCCESLLHQHEARCQSPGGISIPACHLLPSCKTCCSEVLDLVYEAVAVCSSLTLLKNISAKLSVHCNHLQGTHEHPPQRARKSPLLCTIQQTLVLLFPSLLFFFFFSLGCWFFGCFFFTSMNIHANALRSHQTRAPTPLTTKRIWILFPRVFELLI